MTTETSPMHVTTYQLETLLDLPEGVAIDSWEVEDGLLVLRLSGMEAVSEDLTGKRVRAHYKSDPSVQGLRLSGFSAAEDD